MAWGGDDKLRVLEIQSFWNQFLSVQELGIIEWQMTRVLNEEFANFTGCDAENLYGNTGQKNTSCCARGK